MNKIAKIAALAALALTCVASTACADFSADKSITVISREEGSGTRGAFVELTGVEQKIDGKKVDMTTDDAQITNNTAAMLMTVAGDTQAIGYVSLGSLNETVKAVKIEGVEATAQNVADGSYKIARPFNIAYKADGQSDLSKDFIAYVMSAEGQAIINENGYVGSSDAAAVLRALRTLYAPDISDGRLETLAARLGSDVPFFIRGGTQLATGRGEVVSPLPQLAAGWFVVVKPDEGYSTAEMYRRLDEPGSVLVRNSRYMQDAVAANNVHAVAVELHNSFERVVPKDSSLRTIKDALRAQGALGTLLSGSGSAVFGLFDDQSAAAAAAEALKKTWPWVFVARPV